MVTSYRVSTTALLVLTMSLALDGCGGSSNTPPQTHMLTGTVSGLTSSGLVLSVNGSSVPVASGANTISLASSITSGMSYAVTVQTQPIGELCSVTGGTGTMGSADVSNVAVSCSKQVYAIGGTIAGLTASGLVLVNGTDTLSIPSGATSFVMPTKVAYASNYAVMAQGHPAGLQCTVTNGAGTVPGADVANIGVLCTQVESVIYSFAGGADGADPKGTLIQASDGNLYGTTLSGGARNQGTVFKITVAGTETVLYSFAGAPDGAGPIASLIQGSDGNLYGVTNSGGANGYGTVFKITLTGTEVVLYSFADGADGAYPNGSVIQATDGNLYGTTAAGGTGGGGTVFKVTPAGIETVLYSFAGAGAHDGYGPEAGLIQATDGSLYGTTEAGGSTGDGTVFKVSLTGAESVLASLPGGNDTAPLGSLVEAGDGNFYGMSSGGVATVTLGVNAGTIFRITLGGVETVLHSFSGTSDGIEPSASLIQGNDGSLYGMTPSGGEAGLGVVFKITLAGVETVLYSFANGTDGASPRGSLLQANNGHFYGVTSAGGANGYGTVFQIN